MPDSDQNLSSGKLLSRLADLLFVPMIFYVLTQWGEIDGFVAKLLWFGLFILVKNEFLSVRDSYKNYNLPLYLLDFASLLIYLLAVDSLTEPVKPFQYNPSFWFYIGSLWAFYAIWDVIMFKKERGSEYAKKLKAWSIRMFGAAVLTFLCAMLTTKFKSEPASTAEIVIFWAVQIVPGCIIVYAVLCWIIDIKERLAIQGS